MKNGIPKLAILLMAAAVAGFVLLRVSRRHLTPEPPTTAQTSAVKPGQSHPGPATSVTDKLTTCARDLGAATDPAASRQRLQSLREALSPSGTNETSVGIRRFLDAKTDASTGLGFKVGPNGSLKDAPTLRTYLLDYLGQIDRSAGAAYARTILSGSGSPDEWALALRDLALGDTGPDARKLLEEKTRELLHHEDWQQSPSSGYLEAFDTAVFLGGTNLTPDLSELVRKKDNQAVAHAAYLALDRLVNADPSALLNALQADPDLMQGRELTRADFFARADLRDPQQRLVVEKYLLDPRIGSSELQQFSGVFPNANFMISDNLLTPKPTATPGDLTARDAESLKIVNEWLADPRFAKLRPELGRMKTRLEEFTRQAHQAGQ